MFHHLFHLPCNHFTLVFSMKFFGEGSKTGIFISFFFFQGGQGGSGDLSSGMKAAKGRLRGAAVAIP